MLARAFPTLLLHGPIHTTFVRTSNIPPKPWVSGATYATLETLLATVREETVYCVLEAREPDFKFGALSYGDTPLHINEADMDPWDVVVPGYEAPLPTGRRYRISRVLGWLDLENGNHKLMVRLARAPHGYRYDPERANEEIRRFVDEYTGRMRVRGVYKMV